MFYAVLICSDEACAQELEAWGDLEDFDHLLCESCGCLLQTISVDEVETARIVAFPSQSRLSRPRRAA
jgi:hypothetical protein